MPSLLQKVHEQRAGLHAEGDLEATTASTSHKLIRLDVRGRRYLREEVELRAVRKCKMLVRALAQQMRCFVQLARLRELDVTMEKEWEEQSTKLRPERRQRPVHPLTQLIVRHHPIVRPLSTIRRL